MANEQKDGGPARKAIWCCGCHGDVAARLTNGGEIYPHRPDIRSLPFWRCDTCGNYVGCHHKTSNPTQPLGCIPTPEIKAARRKLHAVIDPIWKSGRMKRNAVYAEIAKRLGILEYHTAELRDVATTEAAQQHARDIAREARHD